jgi:hypothetical protein
MCLAWLVVQPNSTTVVCDFFSGTFSYDRNLTSRFIDLGLSLWRGVFFCFVFLSSAPDLSFFSDGM